MHKKENCVFGKGDLNMNWNEVVDKVTPYIVKIKTPYGSGAGFLCLYNKDKNLCGVATAFHVITESENWQEPIRIIHYSSGETLFLNQSDRVIFSDWETDSAVIIFQKPDFELPEKLIGLLPHDSFLGVGVEVGWLGFPGIEPYTLCFFSGTTSARQGSRYLIDGVAINGVSGGPVMCLHKTDGIQIVGIVSAYKANRTAGDTLPGLSYAQDVSHFHDIINHIKSIDEANKKKQEMETQNQ